ncbi:MAG: hypothetical protein WAN35_07875 [Terracidiphilus sp.]
MKTRLVLLFLCASLIPAVQAFAKTILPDACGDDSVKFDVKTLKDPPAPAPPAVGKAQIVFIGSMERSGSIFIGGAPETRVGMDGAWVGVNKGNSYFVLNVTAGEHHLCTVWGKKVGVASLSAEVGKVYYFEAKAKVKIHRYGNGSMEKDTDLTFTQVDEDEGKYRIKASELATSTPNK